MNNTLAYLEPLWTALDRSCLVFGSENKNLMIECLLLFLKNDLLLMGIKYTVALFRVLSEFFSYFHFECIPPSFNVEKHFSSLLTVMPNKLES